uniref:NADH-ubiquinone oxidoreductase chain 2 n=1 Tax=Ptilodactylidae sp. 2 ACP-2013 TaxID=1434563 RepID=A0A3G3FXS6_9COLE|nr:NADH dehydrogenase subunit 2 [Ptilodactylidae sp. 2 ACP-2013]
MKNFYKIIMMMIVISGSLIAISANTWLGMWIGLEINLLSIIPIFTSSSNKMSAESAIKYFIIQAMASSMFLFAVIMMSMYNSFPNKLINMNVLMMILNSSLLTKMGAAPFHFWFPEIMEGLNWMNCLLLMTWQKLAPMAIMSYNIKPSLFMVIIIITSMLISGIMGINQTSIRKILAFSSINHIAWMISSMLFNVTIWILYFIIYSIISLNIIMFLNSFKIFLVKQLFMSMNKNSMIKILFIFNFMSLGGLPPFLGFMPKWLTIQVMITNNFFILAFIMVILTLITLYFYTRLTFSSLIMTINEPKWISSMKINPMIMTFNILTLSSLIFITLMFNWF